MPDQISVSEFVSETNEDYKSPTASNFTTRMAQCRNTVAAIEEVSPGRGGAAGRGAGCAAPSGLAARRGGSREQGATGAGSCRSLSPPGPEERPRLPLRGNGARPGGEGKEKERGGGTAEVLLPPGPRGSRSSRLPALSSEHGGAGAPAAPHPRFSQPGGRGAPALASLSWRPGNPEPIGSARLPSYLEGRLCSPASPTLCPFLHSDT